MKSYRSGPSLDKSNNYPPDRRWARLFGKYFMPIVLGGSLFMYSPKVESKTVDDTVETKESSNYDRLLEKSRSLEVYMHTLSQLQKSIESLRKSPTVASYSVEIFSGFESSGGFKFLESVADKYGGYTPEAKSEIEEKILNPIKRKVLLGSLLSISDELVKHLKNEGRDAEARHIQKTIDDYLRGRIPLRVFNNLARYLVKLELKSESKSLRDRFISNYDVVELRRRVNAWNVAGGLLLNLCRRFIEYYLHNKNSQVLLQKYDKVADEMLGKASELDKNARNLPKHEAKRLKRKATKMRREAKRLKRIVIKTQREQNSVLRRLGKVFGRNQRSAQKIYSELKKRHVPKNPSVNSTKPVPVVKDVDSLAKLEGMINETVDRSVAKLEVLKSVTANSDVKFEPDIDILIRKLDLISKKVEESYNALRKILPRLPADKQKVLIRRINRSYRYIYYRLIWFEGKIDSIYKEYSQGQSLSKLRNDIQQLSSTPLKKSPQKPKSSSTSGATKTSISKDSSSETASKKRPKDEEKASNNVRSKEGSKKVEVELESSTSEPKKVEVKLEGSTSESKESAKGSVSKKDSSKGEVKTIVVYKCPPDKKVSKKSTSNRVDNSEASSSKESKTSDATEDEIITVYLDSDEETKEDKPTKPVKSPSKKSTTKPKETPKVKEKAIEQSKPMQEVKPYEDSTGSSNNSSVVNQVDDSTSMKDTSPKLPLNPVRSRKGFTGLLGSTSGIMTSTSEIGTSDLYVAHIGPDSTFGFMLGVSASGVDRTQELPSLNSEVESQWYYLAPKLGVLGRLDNDSFMGITFGYSTNGNLPVFPVEMLLIDPNYLFEGSVVYSIRGDWIKSPTFNGKFYYEGESSQLYLSGQYIPAPSYSTGYLQGWFNYMMGSRLGLSGNLLFHSYPNDVNSVTYDVVGSLGLYGELDNILKVAPQIGLGYDDHSPKLLYGGAVNLDMSNIHIRLTVLLDSNSKVKYVLPSIVIKGE